MCDGNAVFTKISFIMFKDFWCSTHYIMILLEIFDPKIISCIIFAFLICL